MTLNFILIELNRFRTSYNMNNYETNLNNYFYIIIKLNQLE